MMAYRKDEKAGWRALRLSEDRELWRDSAALFQMAKDGPAKWPECFDWLQVQVDEGLLRRGQRYDFSVFGLCTDKAKVHFWRCMIGCPCRSPTSTTGTWRTTWGEPWKPPRMSPASFGTASGCWRPPSSPRQGDTPTRTGSEPS